MYLDDLVQLAELLFNWFNWFHLTNWFNFKSVDLVTADQLNYLVQLDSCLFTFLFVSGHNNIDNPDQRISSDIQIWSYALPMPIL